MDATTPHPVAAAHQIVALAHANKWCLFAHLPYVHEHRDETL